MPQIPNQRQFMCTTFELTTRRPELQWSQVDITIQQDMRTGAIATGTTERSKPIGATYSIITHERGELPFSAYDRTIHTSLPAETEIAVYYSKSVTKRVNTARSRCHNGADAAWLAKTLKEISENDTFLDFLDRRRLKVRKKSSWPPHYIPYLTNLENDMRIDGWPKPAMRKKSKTVGLFSTEFLYSREACGWKICCMKVARECGCTCKMDWLLSTGSAKCPNEKCERTHCPDSPVLYDQCPMPCVYSKFTRQTYLINGPPASKLQMNTSVLKLIRSENVQVAAEEEIYSLAKLFSEIGGLCSLFIGFSCIFFFEFLEAMLLIRKSDKKKSPNGKGNEFMEDPVLHYSCAEGAKTPFLGQDEKAFDGDPILFNHHQGKSQELIPPLPPPDTFTLPVLLRSSMQTDKGTDGLAPAEINSLQDNSYLLADSRGC